jgi:uncharacterized protein YndB with AHSA1/START domain
MPAIEAAQIGQFELEVDLEAPVERVWTALTEEIDSWWLPDFRATGEGSVVRLDARTGGALVETSPDGVELVWYTVQMVRPGSTLYLVGHTARDWGGPSVSMLKLSLTARPGGSRLSISDSIVGQVSEAQLASVEGGWKNLFGDGLGSYLQSAAHRAG